MSDKHEAAIARLDEILADPEYAIFQHEWVSKEWGAKHFGSNREGEFVSLCTPELLRYLLDRIPK